MTWLRTSEIAHRTALAFVVVLAFLPFALPSQAAPQSNARPVFDVASIKPAANEPGANFTFEPGGRIVIRNFRLEDLIMLAWELQEFRLQGGPPWMDKTRYDVEAQAAGNPTHAQSRLMLQSLLADRFRLVVHRENQDLPIYVLRRKGAFGRDLTQTKGGSCAPLAEFGVAPPTPPGRIPFCGFEAHLIKTQDGLPEMLLVLRGAPMSTIATMLGTNLYRHVEDETNLTGEFDARLEYRPDDFSGKSTSIPGASESTAPSILTAVQEQLGLKLDSEKGPVDVLVVDHAEPPTPN